jgi:hypothetical protein
MSYGRELTTSDWYGGAFHSLVSFQGSFGSFILEEWESSYWIRLFGLKFDIL